MLASPLLIWNFLVLARFGGNTRRHPETRNLFVGKEQESGHTIEVGGGYDSSSIALRKQITGSTGTVVTSTVDIVSVTYFQAAPEHMNQITSIMFPLWTNTAGF